MKYELVNYCEIEPNASRSYSRIHHVSEELNLGDITKVDAKTIPDFNMLVGGSPCTDFSCAGQQKGSIWTCMDCGHKYNPVEQHYLKRDECPKCHSKNLDMTASSLIVEYLRILHEKKPKFCIYENVKNLTGKKFRTTFDLFVKELKEDGYNVYYKVLNAKDYGIPQNRERVILVAIQKSIDNGKFTYPEPFDSGIRLKDLFATYIDDRYYLPKNKVDNFLTNLDEAKKKRLMESIETPLCCASRGRNPENPSSRVVGIPTEQRIEINENGTTNTLTSVQKDNWIIEPSNEYGDGIPDNYTFNPDLFTIRKLIPLECFRLMGFTDEDFERARYYTKDEMIVLRKDRKYKKERSESGEERYVLLSDTHAYKQAGNSIVVNVLYEVYKEIYKAMPELFEDVRLLSLFSGIGAFEKALDMLKVWVDGNFIQGEG